MKKVAVDLLYSEFSSFDKDARDIIKAVGENEVLYLTGSNDYSIIKNVMLLLKFRYRHGQCEFNILSGRFWHLLVLCLLGFNIKTYVVHFIPNKNRAFHVGCLRIFSSKIKVWVYSKSVNSQLSAIGIVPAGVLTSRKVNTEKALRLLNQKKDCAKKKIFFPSSRYGVRQCLDVNKTLNYLSGLSIEISDVFVQGRHLFDKADLNLRNINMHVFDNGLRSDEYDSLFEEAAFVCVNFEIGYEPRASGILLDAISSGCIVLTEDHPINDQYGFPFSVVTTTDRLKAGLFDREAFSKCALSTDIQFSQDWRVFFGI